MDIAVDTIEKQMEMKFQAKLTTKLEEYSIDDAVVEIDRKTQPGFLDEIVKTFLKRSGSRNEKELTHIGFDFIIGGRLLRTAVDDHLRLYADDIDANEILSEKLVEVEYILNYRRPKPIQSIQQDDWVSCVDANDSFIISGSFDNSIRVFTIKDRKNIAMIPDAHEKPITRVKWLKRDGRKKENELFFISCGHDEVSVLRRFNTKTFKTDTVFVYQGHNRSVNCIDTRDDLVATGSFDRTLRLWSSSTDEQDENTLENGNISEVGNPSKRTSKKQKTKASEKSVAKTSRSAIMTLTGHEESVTGVKFLGSSNEINSMASCSMDRSICIWDIEVGECKSKVHSSVPMLSMDFCAEKNLIINTSCDRFIRSWDVRAPDNISVKAGYTGHDAWVSSVAFGPLSTNHFVSGGYDNVVKLWDLRSPKAHLYDLIGHKNKVLDVNWSNPSYVLSGSADSTLKVFATL